MKKLLFILSVLLSLQASAQNAVQTYINQLKTTDELKEAVWGIKAAKLGGEVIATYNEQVRMMPASNMKLISTGLVLNELGGDYRFRTRIAYSGEINGGVLKGDLYIVGGGDPTIGARDSVATALQTTFTQWEKLVRAAGITRIEGRIIGDGRFFDGESRNYAWQLEDSATGDGTVMSGLSFGGGLQSFNITAGAKAGDPVKIEAVYPETPWMTWSHTATTAAPGTGDNLYYSCTELAPVASMTGTLGIDVKPKRITCANCFGAMTCAFYFYRYLENKGIIATEGPADIDAGGLLRDFSTEEMRKAEAPGKLHFIGETYSAPIKDIVRQTNCDSNNFYAESLLRTLAKERKGSASYDACQEVLLDALKKLGVSGAERMQFVDGSGLARKDYVSPDFFVRFLIAMQKSSEYQSFRRSLPGPGYGTLSTRMVNADESVKSRIYMKSGSMNGVRCFSGYILPRSGKAEDIIVFSFLTNNTVTASSRMNFIIDKTVGLLAEEN